MKTKLTALIALFFIASGFYCTNAQETETLFSGEIRHGGFGALVYGATSVNGQISYVRGSRWAWVINMNNSHAVNIGFAGYRTHNEFEPENWTIPATSAPDMKTNYGGFEIEYMNRSNKLVHAGIQTLIGRGRVRYTNPAQSLAETSDKYFVLQPGLNLNVNVTNWFRLSGGVYYRYVSGADLNGTSDKDLSGILSFIGLKFGQF